MPGAHEDAEAIQTDRAFVAAEDCWNDDYSLRRILRFKAVSG